MSKKDTNNRNKALDDHFLYGCVAVVLLCVGYWVSTKIMGNRSTDRGSFGDMFGALNTIFTGFAFVGLWVNYQLQKKRVA